MRWVYRCNRCRTRNTFKEPLWRYAKGKKCRSCGHGSFYLDKERMTRKPCYCDGGLLGRTGSIPHRPGSKCCIDNPWNPYYRAARAGAPQDALLDIAAELAFESEGGRVVETEGRPF